jgi:ATP-binding cassette, subfamily B, bacterial
VTHQESDLSFAQARAILVRAARLFRPYRRSIAIVTATIVVSSALSVANPLLIRAIFDDALFPHHGRANVHLLLELVGVMIVVAAAASGAGVLQTYIATRIGQSVMRDLRTALYTTLKRMPLRFFTDTRTGEIQSRLTNDVGEIDDVITHVAQDSVANVVILVSSLVAMLVMSWQLTVLTFCVVPFFAWLTHRTGRAGHRKWKAVQESLADMTAVTEETLSVSGVLLAKVFGRDADDVRRFGELNERLSRLQTVARVNGRVFWAWVGIFFSAAPAGSSCSPRSPSATAGRASARVRSSRSPRCKAGSSGPSASSSTTRSRSVPRSRCSSGSSRTSTSSPSCANRPRRATSCLNVFRE